jgi:hypothetical protein
MIPDDVRGDWEGRFAGTNSGRLALRLTPAPDTTVIEARLDDDAGATGYLVGTAVISDGRLTARLSSRDPADPEQFGVVTVTASQDGNNNLAGGWTTTYGTRGTFTATRPPPSPIPEGAQQARVARFNFFEKQARIRACAVNLDVLRRIQSILRSAGEEAASLHERKQYAAIRGGPAELTRLYRVTLMLRGAQGEVTATDDPAAIEPDLLSFPLQSVDFEIGFNYRAATGNQAFNRATVRFDFTRPPAIDLSTSTSEPTPNTSTVSVFGSDTLWVAGVFERVNAVIQQSAVNSFWLHRAHAYDVALLVLGLPLAFVLGLSAAGRTPAMPGVNTIVTQIAVALLVGVLSLLGFRVAFGLTRWLLPYIEYVPSPAPLHRRVRLFLATAILAIVTSVLGSGIYALLP